MRMNTTLTRRPTSPDPDIQDSNLTIPEAALIEVFRALTDSGRLELLALAMKMQRTG